MKKWLHRLPLVYIFILTCLFGCGGDDIEENGGSIADPALDDRNQIPTVTIEKLRGQKEVSSDCGVVGEKVWWRLNAEPAPKTDLAVIVGNRWAIIPKSQKHSEEFSNSISHGSIQIDPLPTVSIVGKGIVVDLEKLQRNLPVASRGGHIIPKDYEFPLYKVGEPKRIIRQVELSDIANAVLLKATPSKGALAANKSIILEFDKDPGQLACSMGRISGSGKSRTITPDDRGFLIGALDITIAWGICGKSSSKTLSYTVVPPD